MKHKLGDAYINQNAAKLDSVFTYVLFKRVFIILLICLSLPISFTLFICIAILIRISGQKEVIFSQTRPGLHGVPFTIFKFCTMKKKTSSEQFQLTKENDKRVTPIGRLLRKTRLDELPQLWNILKGEMAFIGPRPVPMELYDHYKANIPNYDRRHTIRPGITGWAQINLGYTSTLEGEIEKVKYDLAYIENQSMVLDAQIVWSTVTGIFTRGQVN